MQWNAHIHMKASPYQLHRFGDIQSFTDPGCNNCVVYPHRYLTFLWEVAEVKLQAAISVGSLNHANYAVYRQAVKNNLAETAKQYVLEVPLH